MDGMERVLRRLPFAERYRCAPVCRDFNAALVSAPSLWSDDAHICIHTERGLQSCARWLARRRSRMRVLHLDLHPHRMQEDMLALLCMVAPSLESLTVVAPYCTFQQPIFLSLLCRVEHLAIHGKGVFFSRHACAAGLQRLRSLAVTSIGGPFSAPGLNHLTGLRDLALHTYAYALPVAPLALPSLTALRLDRSNIRAVAARLGALTSLLALSMASCNLLYVPECVEQLVNLTRLDLSRNSLTAYDEDGDADPNGALGFMQMLPRLQLLNLRHNALDDTGLENIPLLATRTLHTLDIAHNLSDECAPGPALRSVTKLICSGVPDISNFPSLHTLEIHPSGPTPPLRCQTPHASLRQVVVIGGGCVDAIAEVRRANPDVCVMNPSTRAPFC